MKFYGNIGLHNFLSRYKGLRIRYKIKAFLDELKCAWQRAWYGYSSYDVWNFNDSMATMMANILKTFKENNQFILVDACTRMELTTKEANEIYSKMIKYLEYMNSEELCYKELFSSNIYEDEVSKDKMIATYKLMEEYKDKCFDLLKVYWYQLWW